MPDRTHRLCLFESHTSDSESIKRDTPTRRVSSNDISVRNPESAHLEPERVVIRRILYPSSFQPPTGSSRSFSSVKARLQQDALPGRLEGTGDSHGGF
ncbi:unnamed protein product [Aureobasidium uvarum]|uniref:Uncharacterized protein n=1 Tax=Aureobasidium uvarum TaxID=2773716 RepID=A0A9N8KEL2_9PEZI|nr:unnamed protein product [Aureobasidium uvarum]